MLGLEDYLFYFLALITFLGGCFVITVRNPIYSALFLVVSMLGIAGIFASLDSWFVAGVQLIVYAGAVMVLFVMVLMLFNLKYEIRAFSPGAVSGFLKLVSVALLLGPICAAVYNSAETVFTPPPAAVAGKADLTQQLAETLFTKYIFGFEVIGVLLLVVAIGAVTLSRISGGTHADH